MKKFLRHKNLIEIAAQCKEQGLYLGRELYDRNQSDYVVVARKWSDIQNAEGFVLFNVFNGRFHGETDFGKVRFNESSLLDDLPWYAALLEFFFVSPLETPKQSTVIGKTLSEELTAQAKMLASHGKPKKVSGLNAALNHQMGGSGKHT